MTEREKLAKNYKPSDIEDKWYKIWLDKNYFHSEPDEREAYTIVIPPPNVTGVLHMGHMLNNTIQDVLIRHARMQGKNACWLPGTDHASIATESKVVGMLKEKGIEKKDISRDEFLKYAWEWKEKHGGIILEQLKKLGASCDWERTKFTMDQQLSDSVTIVFVKLYNKGLIYRGIRMVNWDPVAKTAVSDEEVNYKEIQSKLFYVKYQIQDIDEYITVATTRPETILGDTAICVHPEDERYLHLVGKKAIVPMVNRVIPVIADPYVDRDFGTGALKITPAHDINDYSIGLKYHLPVIDIFDDNGHLNEKAELFIGTDRFEARILTTELLQQSGALVKTEDYINKVGYSERTDAVIEPRISVQWFLRMKELAAPALEHVVNGDITFYPSKFVNTYKYWMENVTDWCISRQLWWGHRIPAWYNESGDIVVAHDQEEAFQKFKKEFPDTDLLKIKQDDDVLDTWFSSWLWPISTFDGIRNPANKDIHYYYPTNDLITAPDIIFFWVARMIMAGYEFLGEKPFTNVYFTGTVRDKLRRKMSKSLGNSPDPIELMNRFGADGVRIGMLLSSPAGNDLLFEETLCEQGRNFNNKVWNAFRLVKGWEVDPEMTQTPSAALAVSCFNARLNQEIELIEDFYKKFRISDILMSLYKLFWDDFSAWYLEMIKPKKGGKIDQSTYDLTILFFEKMLKLLHPFIPFITEELYHQLKERKENDDLILASYPKKESYHEELIRSFEFVKEIVTAIRDFRKKNELKPAEKIHLQILESEKSNDQFDDLVIDFCNLYSIEYLSQKPEATASFFVRKTEYFVPLETAVNKEEEIQKTEEELAYYKGFLSTVMLKLNNEKFIQNAPEQVVVLERKKKMDSESKINSLEEKLKKLRK